MKTIRLLDGSEWSVDEILEKMYDNVFYYGYLGTNALSSTSCKKLCESVEDYLFEDNNFSPDLKPLRDGRLFHVTVLESDKMKDYYDFIDVPTRRSRDFKELKKTSKKEVMTEKERLWAVDLKKHILKHSRSGELIKNGEPEVPNINYVFGLPFRGKADLLCDDRVVDIKTTGDIANWEYNKYFYGYDIQAYLYTKLFNRDNFEFIIIDKRTKKVITDEATGDFLVSGQRKVERAVDNYVKYFAI
jgi:hypothetical protein